MVISMVKSNWIFQLCQKPFYSGLHMSLECRDIKVWPISGCITMSLVSSPYPEGQSQQTELQKTNRASLFLTY